MDKNADAAMVAWKVADTHARDAEAKLKQAWDEYTKVRGAPPPEDLIHEVARLRAQANDRLTGAIAAVSRAATPRESPGPSRKG
jgi:hypothetical protein